jgi:hypothetical protein
MYIKKLEKVFKKKTERKKVEEEKRGRWGSLLLYNF